MLEYSTDAFYSCHLSVLFLSFTNWHVHPYLICQYFPDRPPGEVSPNRPTPWVHYKYPSIQMRWEASHLNGSVLVAYSRSGSTKGVLMQSVWAWYPVTRLQVICSDFPSLCDIEIKQWKRSLYLYFRCMCIHVSSSSSFYFPCFPCKSVPYFLDRSTCTVHVWRKTNLLPPCHPVVSSVFSANDSQR